eukprot:IDg9634t1
MMARLWTVLRDWWFQKPAYEDGNPFALPTPPVQHESKGGVDGDCPSRQLSENKALRWHRSVIQAINCMEERRCALAAPLRCSGRGRPVARRATCALLIRTATQSLAAIGMCRLESPPSTASPPVQYTAIKVCCIAVLTPCDHPQATAA